jgi:hypothetical protein
MARVVNFGDPDFEPSDEELVALSKEAFADVGERRRAALARLHAEIADLRQARTPRARPASRETP